MHGSDGHAQDAEAEVAHQRTNPWGIEPVFFGDATATALQTSGRALPDGLQ
jgi:hypothetical protein